MAAGDVNVNALTTITDEPTTTDSLVAVNRNTNEGEIIDYNLLADKILNKLTSKAYSGLSTTSKLLVGAINELDSDVASLNSRLESAAMITRLTTSIRTDTTRQALADWLTENNSSMPSSKGCLLALRASNYTSFDCAFGILNKVSDSYGRLILVSYYTAWTGEFRLDSGTWSPV